PAGASMLILFSIITAFIGALTYWFSEWRALAIIILFLIINYVTSLGWFSHPNQAYGLDYDGYRPTYSYDNLQAVCFSERVAADRLATERILQRWERRVAPGRAKPKMVLLCASGGGLKAAVWSTHVLQTIDRRTQGALFDQTVLMTGASGGMLGMAYLRELYRQQQQGDTIDYHDPYYRDRISLDLLNSIAFTIVSTDLFLPWTHFTYAGQTYFKDRGYIFEEQLNENTEGILDHPLSAYRQDEAEGRIPLLFLTPSIVNDGRQLVVSPQGVSYMMIPPAGLNQRGSFEPDAVDFGWLFGEQQADSLRFLSALRMSATYPYVLPNVHLPSSPEIEVVDAGFRDNYGILAATRFLQVFKDWIEENTSGVILIQISSSEKIERIEANPPQGLFSSFFSPLGIAGKVFTVQEFEHDASLSFIYDLLGPDQVDLVRFIYQPRDKNRLEASVSFHITEQEEEDVIQALELPENQSGLRRLEQLLAR
ncbi:MAG: patatin-like phospholipase family protein, partial [Lewinella sp.]|nr:patatin-like phospholipase family protein [Lewinella sp.]